MVGRPGLTAACLVALSCAASATAQVRFALPSAAEIAASKSFVAPKIGDAYAKRLAQQPDMQGHWVGTGRGFDPDNFHVPAEGANIAPSAVFSSVPGSYNTAIPYKPEYRARYMQAVADRAAGMDRDTFALCKPYGFPRFMRGPAGFDLLQSPEMVVLQDAYDNEHRRIHVGARPHPSPEGAEESDARTYTGHSVARWDGDVLVVETVNVAPGVFDDTLAPHSGEIRAVERFRLAGKDLLEVEMTFEDPVMFTGPWNVTRYYRRTLVSALQNQPGSPATEAERRYRFHNLLDIPCEPTVDMSKGYQSLILPQETDAESPAGQ